MTYLKASAARSVVAAASLVLLIGTAAVAQTVPAPGTLLISNGTSAQAVGKPASATATIGPFASKAHVFVSVIGTAKGEPGDPMLFDTSLFLGTFLWAGNGDYWPAVRGIEGHVTATAGYEFVLPANTRQTVRGVAKILNANSLSAAQIEAKLTYRAIAIK